MKKLFFLFPVALLLSLNTWAQDSPKSKTNSAAQSTATVEKPKATKLNRAAQIQKISSKRVDKSKMKSKKSATLNKSADKKNAPK